MDNAAVATEAYRRMQRQESEIAILQQRISNLSLQLQASLEEGREKRRRRHQPLSPHQFNIREVKAEASNSKSATVVQAQRERMGRKASMATRQVLDALLPAQPELMADHPSIERIMDMFQRPAAHMDYLNSQQFAKDLLKVASKCRHILEREPRVVFLQSPCYVFGDIHGNLEDLHFFSDNIWRLGMSLTAGNFLFLGDYVDRGLSCLETVSYMFAMKVQLPHKVYLLRGNHETRDVNGWEEHYGERSFIWQCRARFGDDVGYRLWEACNQVFDRLPLSAVIDQDIFCVHGGIPRPVGRPDSSRIQDILTVPKVAGINPPYEHETDEYQQVASDCIWSDPASEEQEMTSVDPETGYGESLRGGGAICFGNKAVTDFLHQQGFSYIMRAHEAHAEGVAVSKKARVFTVFSTSQDHNQGAHAMAGCILVDNNQLQVINRSPAYKNQYVHRRDSVSLATLSEKEIQQRMQLGLIRDTPPSHHHQVQADAAAMAYYQYDQDESGDDEDDEDVQKWQDLESEDESEQEKEEKQETDYRLARTRRSSIDLAAISCNMHDAAVVTNDAATAHGTMLWQEGTMSGDAGSANNKIPSSPTSKRNRQSSLSFSPIDETEEGDDEVATVNGDEDEMDQEAT